MKVTGEMMEDTSATNRHAWPQLKDADRWRKVVQGSEKKHMYKITLILKDLQHPKMWDMSFPLFFLVKLCLAKCPKSKITVPNV